MSSTYETGSVTSEPARWLDDLQVAHDEGFRFFDFLTAVDMSDDLQAPGLEVIVHLYDFDAHPMREVMIRARVPEGASLPSCTAIWLGAAWHERETFEMFGLNFDNFDDASGYGLRPLLLPDGFEGTPLRKSFVLAARASKPWPGSKDPADGAAKPGRAPRRKLLPPGVPDDKWGPR